MAGTASLEKANRRVATIAAGGFFFMLGLSFAAVPLYDLFCRVTGYGGTTQVATKAPARITKREIAVRLDANVVPGLGWRFTPELSAVTVKTGEVRTVSYTIRNMSDRSTTGIASYNVTPDQMGAWFSKISCFCFTEITLQPGESRVEEVTFFVDPEMETNRELDAIHTLTLSYTFFPSKSGSKPLADASTVMKPDTRSGLVLE